MSYQNESFGMMDPGYFVPRTQIISWLNNLLNLNLTKIEQLGAGSVYCQILDVIHPGKVSLSKVNWKAKNDYQFINNLKVLQNAFDKIGIKRHVEVQKLAKAKYQDNLEFIQWLKRYFDLNCGERGNNYLADEKRGTTKIDFSFAQKTVTPKTYNSVGQIMKEPIETKVKKEEQPKEITKPRKSLLPEKKVQSTKQTPVRKIKQQEKNKQSVSIKKVTQKDLNNQIKEQFKLQNQKGSEEHNIVMNRQFQELQVQLEEMRNKFEQSRQIINDLEVKIGMISEVIISADEPDMKINLIEGILEIQSESKQLKLEEFPVHKSQTSQIDEIL